MVVWRNWLDLEGGNLIQERVERARVRGGSLDGAHELFENDSDMKWEIERWRAGLPALRRSSRARGAGIIMENTIVSLCGRDRSR